VSENTPNDIFKLVKDENVEYVDVRFCDLPGTMQHFTIPIYVFDENDGRYGMASAHAICLSKPSVFAMSR
jgi:glutamine synthetase